jgi:hypothetical protein
MSKESAIKLSWTGLGVMIGIATGLATASMAWGDMRTDVKYIRVTVDQDHAKVEQHESRIQRIEEWFAMK